MDEEEGNPIELVKSEKEKEILNKYINNYKLRDGRNIGEDEKYLKANNITTAETLYKNILASNIVRKDTAEFDNRGLFSGIGKLFNRSATN